MNRNAEITSYGKWTPVTVTWTGTQDDGSTLVHSRTETHWLDAAHLISSVSNPNVINVDLRNVETDNLAGFRAYCASLAPRGLHW